MTHIKDVLTFIILVFLVVNCDSSSSNSSDSFDITDYTEGIYSGDGTFLVKNPTQNHQCENGCTVSSTGTATMTDEGEGRAIFYVAVELSDDIPDPARTLINYEGSYDEDGWTYVHQSGHMTIDTKGDIDGFFEFESNGISLAYTYSGVISPDKLELTFTIEVTEGNDEGSPTGLINEHQVEFERITVGKKPSSITMENHPNILNSDDTAADGIILPVPGWNP